MKRVIVNIAWMIVLFGGSIFFSLSYSAELCANEDATYYTALTAEPQSIDPVDIRSFFATHLGSQVLEGLLMLDDEMNVVPGAAQGWVIEDEGKRVTFHLRKNIIFHDGSRMTARDVAYSLSRLIFREEKNLFFKP